MKILILDTSILCVWLGVPGMDDCGPDRDKWNKARVEAKIAEELHNQTTFVLPLASIIETGNHIAQAPHSRYELGIALADLMKKSAEEKTPWAAFSDQSVLWSPESLKRLAETWPTHASQKLSLGDVTITMVAEYYSQMGFQVEILTGDIGLRAYSPQTAPEVPRRKKRLSF